MNSYYDDLVASPDPARRVGWKRRIGQAYRYELVRQQLEGGEHLIDVGCGEAELAHYLADSDCPVRYVGIESRPLTPDRRGTITFADYRELEPPECNCVVAIGALVGAEPAATERGSVTKAKELLSWMRRTRARTGLLIAIDLDVLDASPWLADPHLDGVRSGWFEEADFTVGRASRFELTVGWGVSIDRHRAIVDAFSGPFGPFDPAEGAWLAAEVGNVEVAREFLSMEEVGDAALAGIVEARIEQLESVREA